MIKYACSLSYGLKKIYIYIYIYIYICIYNIYVYIGCCIFYIHFNHLNLIKLRNNNLII